MTDLRGRYVEQIRQNGARLSPDLAEAFATVPREIFVADGFLRRDGTWAMPGARDFLDLVYRDDVLVTKVEGALPVSSSSQPSLMAIMIEALNVRAGMRVLEIGAGTGYNAALLSAIGADVTSVDVQPDVAARARAALGLAGVENASVVLGDGYAGMPGEHFDRVLVTVGVAGISPRWLAQLGVYRSESAAASAAGGLGAVRAAELPDVEASPGALVVVPVEHAGMHPVLAVRRIAGGPVTATVICPSGFMSAAGPLTAEHAHAHPSPAPAGTLGKFTQVAAPRWDPPLESLGYRDLWYAAGVWHRRATHAALRRDQSNLALLDEARTGGAIILPSGAILAGGDQAEQYAHDAVEILDRWESAGRPPMQAWQITLALTEAPDTPIWVPAEWSLKHPTTA